MVLDGCSYATTRMDHVTTDEGTAFAYAQSGDGRDLVLVHGITENHRAWDPWCPASRCSGG